jgi:ATP-binding cassette subfamily B protein
MVFLEEVAMEKFTVIISSYLNVIIGIIMLSIFNLKMGLLIFIITLISIIMLNIIFKRSKEIAPRRQIVVENLIKSVLEYVRGLSVSKAFNLSGDKSKAASNSFRNIRDIMIEFEKCLTPLLLWHEILIGVGIACVIFMAGILANNGQLEIYFAVMMIVFSFEIFIPLLTLSRTIPMIRIVDAGLDRYQKIKDAKLLDNDGKNIKLDKFDIEFNKVTFAYEDKDIIKDMSFKIEEGTMTALVGKSGCGKTTIANLIARFWDIQNGDIKIGGVSTKSMTCESLLDNISMVFQKVYLFNDTIINNIKFAKPEASYDEIVEVCKKARCHDFILKLDDGYNTMVGEGGCTLSGGEKQRISIARAMLKDAPIILLDEATASVDADNEAYIKEAISDLVRNKTLVVIAHKLSTIKNANQILVIDSGKITQRGTHKELIDLEGYYQDFWKRRAVAKSWTL